MPNLQLIAESVFMKTVSACDRMELFFRIFITGSLFSLFGLVLALDQNNPHAIWTTAYSMEGPNEIAQNNLLTMIPEVREEWRLSFEVNPRDYSFKGYASLLHLTIGGNRGEVGDRSPAIWLHRTRGVLVSASIDGKASYSKTVKPLPPAGMWTRLEVSQTLAGKEHMFSITIGNNKVFTKRNTKPIMLKDVEVYSGSPWYTNQKGLLRNLTFETKTPNCVLAGKTKFNFKKGSYRCFFFTV